MVAMAHTLVWVVSGVPASTSERLQSQLPRRSCLFLTSIVAWCFLRRSRPRIPSVVRGLTTSAWVSKVLPCATTVTCTWPCTSRGEPSTSTSFWSDQGCSLVGCLALTRLQTSLPMRVTAAPVSRRKDMGSPPTSPSMHKHSTGVMGYMYRG